MSLRRIELRNWLQFNTRRHFSWMLTTFLTTATLQSEQFWTCFWGEGSTVRSKLNKFEHIWGTRAGTLYRERTASARTLIGRYGYGGWVCAEVQRRARALYRDPTCLWTKWLTDRHDWKHYLPTTSFAAGKNCNKFKTKLFCLDRTVVRIIGFGWPL